MPSIALIGPGAIGATVAARLARSPDHHVAVCVRTPFGHLRIDAPEGLISAIPQLLLSPVNAMIVALLDAASAA
ncbi:MAG: 2-dehydropantoate 2-reductase [Rubritepida sp.]|nr:2-dehydropantoate 2-reductase [Rubritepida sp.]